ncbi:MAG TPA: O-antigen ligase family protein [Terriglobia bacterium]|nr:O-antigen ligase family protein [Terriglobia bacterium]
MPIIVRDRKKLFQNRLVLAALVFVLIQWLAALLSAEFTLNAIKGAVRVTAGFTLLCSTLSVRDRRGLLHVWAASAIVAALYGLVDYNGFGVRGLFRETEFYVGSVLRLSGSFEYPNTAAAFLAMSLPLVWIATNSRWVRVLGSLLIWVALILTYSRGAIIAVVLMLGIWMIVGRARAAFYFGGLSAVAFAALVVLHPSLLERFRETQPLPALSAEYEPEFNLLRRHPDELSEMAVRVKNVGTTAWLATKDKPFTLSYWWNDLERRKPLKTATIYTSIPLPVQPQDSVAIRAPFRTPDEPGLYLLTWDISKSGSEWFSGTGVFPGLVEADIQPGNESWSGHGDISRWYGREISKLYVANVPLSRNELWRSALDMVLQHPILGVGPDNFRLLSGRRFGLSHWDEKVRSNSLYLELLSGSGLAGLAAFVVMMASVRRSTGAPALALGIFVIHGWVDVFLMTTPIYFAFWILLGQADENQIRADGDDSPKLQAEGSRFNARAHSS